MKYILRIYIKNGIRMVESGIKEIEADWFSAAVLKVKSRPFGYVVVEDTLS